MTNLMWKAFKKTCRENFRFFKMGRIVVHFTERPEYVYMVDGSTKCFVAQQQYNCRVSLERFNSFILTATYAAKQYYFGSAKRRVTRTLQTVTSYVHCLSVLLVRVFNASCDRFGMVQFLYP